MSDTIEIELSKPLTSKDGATIDKLVLREPTVKDHIAAEKISGGVIQRTLAIIASVTGHPIPVLEEMRSSDFRRVDAALGGLEGNDPEPTGETPPS